MDSLQIVNINKIIGQISSQLIFLNNNNNGINTDHNKIHLTSIIKLITINSNLDNNSTILLEINRWDKWDLKVKLKIKRISVQI